MRKQMERVSLETGNWVAWITVAVIIAFSAGWVARALAVSCWNFPAV